MRVRHTPMPPSSPRGSVLGTILGPCLIASVIGLAGFTVPTAHAADDVILTGMTEHDGRPVLDPVTLGADYEQLIRELGALVGTHAMAPPTTTGATGFEITLETTAIFHDLYGQGERAFAGRPSPWARAMDDEISPILLSGTGIGIRKGLPFSVELSLKGRWISVSRQGTIGGEVRAAILEGKRGWPDVGLHLGYTGYVGNRELRMGVLDAGLSIGGTAYAGKEGTPRKARIQPWVDVSLLSVSAAPLIDGETAALIGATAYGTRTPDPEAVPTTRPLVMPRFSAGLQLEGQVFLVRFTGGFTLPAVPHVGVSIGFRR